MRWCSDDVSAIVVVVVGGMHLSGIIVVIKQFLFWIFIINNFVCLQQIFQTTMSVGFYESEISFLFSLKGCNRKKRRIESSFRWLLHFHSPSDELKHAAATQTIITSKWEMQMKGEPFDYTDYSFVDEFLIKNISWNVCFCLNLKLPSFRMRVSSARSDSVVWIW